MRALAAIVFLTVLTSCNSRPADVADNTVVSANEPQSTNASSNETVGDPVPTASMTENAATPAGVDTQEPAPDLPLDKGVYVEPGVSCSNPPNASWRIWNGEGLSGSTTHNCHASPVIEAGGDITVEQTCTDNYSDKPSSRSFVMRIRDRQHFSQRADGGADQSFRLCPASELPGWLRDAKR